MFSPIFLATLVTIVPAMATLWYYLRRYQGHFHEQLLFFSLIVGFFAGLFATAAEVFLFRFGDPAFIGSVGAGVAFLFFVVGLAFFESGVKAVVMGFRRFRLKRDAPYYGVALGLGMGSMIAMMLIANALRLGELHATPYTLVTGVAAALIPLGAIFVHGAAGAWVGKGSAEGKLWRGWGIATLLQAPVMGVYWLWWPSIGRGDVVLLFPPLVSVAYGVALLAITQRRVLDEVVPKEIRDLVRRDQRRQRRQKMRGDTAARAGTATGDLAAGAAAASGAMRGVQTRGDAAVADGEATGEHHGESDASADSEPAAQGDREK